MGRNEIFVDNKYNHKFNRDSTIFKLHYNKFFISHFFFYVNKLWFIYLYYFVIAHTLFTTFTTYATIFTLIATYFG